MKERVGVWVRRYGLAELAGIATALAGSFLVHAFTTNEIAAAYGGALGENVGFYGLIVARELVTDRRHAHSDGKPYGSHGMLRTAAKLIVEFGPAELLDSAVIRPLAMALGTIHLGREWGVIAGKLAADVTFYIPAILAYEQQRRIDRSRHTE